MVDIRLSTLRFISSSFCVAARTRAATAAGSSVPAGPVPPATGDAPETPQQDSGEAIAKVIPLGIFNAHEEAKKRW